MIKQKQIFQKHNKYLDLNFDLTSIKIEYVYKGCFNDTNKKNLTLKNKKYFFKYDTPQVCFSSCLNQGFKYAGLKEYG